MNEHLEAEASRKMLPKSAVVREALERSLKRPCGAGRTGLEGTCAKRSGQICADLRIERHPAVIGDDLPGIYANIARGNSEAAGRVLNATEETFAQIAAQPESGVLYPTRNPKMKTVRMLPVSGFNHYLVFYRIEGDAVRIL